MVGELDDLKHRKDDRGTSDASRCASAWIDSEQLLAQSGTTWLVNGGGPGALAVNDALRQLPLVSRTMQKDKEILAYALAVKATLNNETNGDSTVLVTSDVNLKLLARNHGIGEYIASHHVSTQPRHQSTTPPRDFVTETYGCEGGHDCGFDVVRRGRR